MVTIKVRQRVHTWSRARPSPSLRWMMCELSHRYHVRSLLSEANTDSIGWYSGPRDG
jgi:glucuronate isomerase